MQKQKKTIKDFYPPMKDRGGMKQPAHTKYGIDPLPNSMPSIGKGLVRYHANLAYEKNYKGSKSEKRK